MGLRSHAASRAQSGLRRVLYYEFRPIETDLRHGPHVPGYVPLKQHVLAECLRRRAAAPYAAGAWPFEYALPLPAGPPPMFRYVHEEFFREPAPTG